MRAVMFYGPDKPITLETIPDPTPGEGEMVIKVGRCGICGSDVHLTQVHGFYPENEPLGHEYAGEVVAVGKGVEGYKLGDVVTAMPAAGCGQCIPCLQGTPLMCESGIVGYSGGFADYMRVAARSSLLLPSSLSLADGALVEPLAVGLHGAALASFNRGSRILVIGAGAIGLSVAHWARLLGAGKIVVGARTTARAELCKQLGATEFVQMGGEDEVALVREALGGAPDVVFECVGAVGALSQAVNHVRSNGTVVSMGTCTKPDSVIPILATFKQIKLLFSMAYSLDDFRFTADMLDAGHVEPRLMMGQTISLEEVPDMLIAMRTKKNNDVKVQVDLSL